MDIAIIKYTVGQIVFGKIKGYPPWPAVITALPKGNKLAKIAYFNSGECSELSFKKITPYHAADKIVERYLNKNQGFTKAYFEMQLVAEKEAKKKTTKPTKQTYKQPKLILKLLSKDEILKIQGDLKKKKKRDISGRSY